MTISPTLRPRLKLAGYVFLGLLALAVLSLSIVQLMMAYSDAADNMKAYSQIEADARGWPNADKRGAFLMLSETHAPKFDSKLIELLATTDAGVVDEQAGIHLLS